MRIAAIFLEDQDYGYGYGYGYGNKTINFGGRYNYNVEIRDAQCFISRIETKSFIPNLFDNTGVVTNVSAIVGTNGSGKTTLVYNLINSIQENFRSGFQIWEDDSHWYLNGFTLNIKVILEKNTPTPKKVYKRLSTIFYNPYLDFKRSAAGIDISSDKYLIEDLKNVPDTYDANGDVVIEERLRKNTYHRFINFQQSIFSTGIRERYGLLNQDIYRITFTRHRIPVDFEIISFDNTPTNFRDFLQWLFDKINEEYKSLDRNTSSDQELFELNKLQIKNLIITDIFCLLLALMEQSNTFLEEGHLTEYFEKNMESFEELTSVEMLKIWLKNYYYSKGEKNPLPDIEIIRIIDFLFKKIDMMSFNVDFLMLDWRNKSLYFNENDIRKLTKLNQNLLNALPKYYPLDEDGGQKIYDGLNHLQQFINFEYASRQLSSGETSMLNLFSRIYDFFEKNIIHTQTIFKSEYYVLFLDEADLGFHPEWKRTYVSSIIEFCSDFFEKVEAKVQVVLCTHDPLSLSDIPNKNITYLHERKILSYPDVLRPSRSFAANITDLLSNSFFLKNGLIGDFAKNKINDVLGFLNTQILEKEIHNIKMEQELAYSKAQNVLKIQKEMELKELLETTPELSLSYCKSLIENVDEPLIKSAMEEMYYQLNPNKEESIESIKAYAKRIGRNDIADTL